MNEITRSSRQMRTGVDHHDRCHKALVDWDATNATNTTIKF
jgi:hypothetical protein